MQPELTCGAPVCRPDTLSYRSRAVERVIRAMHESLGEPLSLRGMARIALLSPYHFNRVFRQITGIPPFQFLTALRLEAAKRLLFTTQRSVTDVCFDAGYNSLGSFITRFTHLVGQSPRHLRRLKQDGASGLEQLAARGANKTSDGAVPVAVCGRVKGPESFAGRVFVGLFPEPIPQGRPVGCAILTGPGRYVIEGVPDGVYYVLALGVPRAGGPRGYILGEDSFRGRAGPVMVRGGRATGPTAVVLRPALLTDPPILVTVPFLLRGARTAVDSAACPSLVANGPCDSADGGGIDWCGISNRGEEERIRGR